MIIRSTYDNFKKDQHTGIVSWKMDTVKGSSFEVSAKGENRANQPYSEDGKYKEFVRWEGLANNVLQLGDFTEVGVKYQHTSRRFDKSIYDIDDYDRDSVALNVVHDRYSFFPLLLEYRYLRQDNNDPVEYSTDFDTHTIFLGVRWREQARLSGTLRLGYLKGYFDEADNASGFVTDTELTYLFSDITTFTLNLNRYVSGTTATARDTGRYYVATGGKFSVIHQRWDPLKITLDFAYTNRDYEQFLFE